MSATFITGAMTTAGIAIVVYLLDSWYARRWLKFEKQTIAYVAAAVLIGIFGEVFVETIYNAIFGQPLWYYQVLPVHHAYTSLFSTVLWTMYGLHIYWVKVALDDKYKKLSRWKLATIFAVESLLLETFANVVWLAVFGKYIYYYTPSDLWHATTLVNIPCYFGASWVMIGAVKRFRHDPWFYLAMSGLILLVFLWFI